MCAEFAHIGNLASLRLLHMNIALDSVLVGDDGDLHDWAWGSVPLV
jgi:hypothetical protein